MSSSNPPVNLGISDKERVYKQFLSLLEAKLNYNRALNVIIDSYIVFVWTKTEAAAIITERVLTNTSGIIIILDDNQHELACFTIQRCGFISRFLAKLYEHIIRLRWKKGMLKPISKGQAYRFFTGCQMR